MADVGGVPPWEQPSAKLAATCARVACRGQRTTPGLLATLAWQAVEGAKMPRAGHSAPCLVRQTPEQRGTWHAKHQRSTGHPAGRPQ